MTKFTTQWMTTIFKNFRGLAMDNIDIDEVFTDSRKMARNGLFVPIVGENFDGHHFLQDAIANGAKAALWQEDKEVPDSLPQDFPLFIVEDTVEGMQKLASHYRDHVNPKVIAITGSNGKTTTKDFVAGVIQSTCKTWKTQGNLNNHIGLPFTILQMPKDTEVLITEMGMNHFGEIEVLSKIAKPDIAIITNIGESHIEFLGSREGIAKAKSEIITGLKNDGVLLFDGDEPLLQTLINKTKSYRIGFSKENDFTITNVHITNDDTQFLLNGELFSIHALGSHQAKNASFAILCGNLLSIPKETIRKSLLKIELSNMRFEKIKTKEGALLINDAYNASATSMKASIEVVKKMDAERKVLVLGDILEVGEQGKAIHQSVAEVIEPPIDALYTYGDLSKEIANALGQKKQPITIESFQSKEELTEALRNEVKPGTLILFKASRGMKLEEVIEQFI